MAVRTLDVEEVLRPVIAASSAAQLEAEFGLYVIAP